MSKLVDKMNGVFIFLRCQLSGIYFASLLCQRQFGSLMQQLVCLKVAPIKQQDMNQMHCAVDDSCLIRQGSLTKDSHPPPCQLSLIFKVTFCELVKIHWSRGEPAT